FRAYGLGDPQAPKFSDRIAAGRKSDGGSRALYTHGREKQMVRKGSASGRLEEVRLGPRRSRQRGTADGRCDQAKHDFSTISIRPASQGRSHGSSAFLVPLRLTMAKKGPI